MSVRTTREGAAEWIGLVVVLILAAVGIWSGAVVEDWPNPILETALSLAFALCILAWASGASRNSMEQLRHPGEILLFRSPRFTYWTRLWLVGLLVPFGSGSITYFLITKGLSMFTLPWILCAVLAVLLVAGYRRGIRQQVHLAHLAVEMIMSDRERAAQRDHLYTFVRGSHYKEAWSLSGAVVNGIVTIANIRAHITMPANRDILWTMSQSPEFAGLVYPRDKS